MRQDAFTRLRRGVASSGSRSRPETKGKYQSGRAEQAFGRVPLLLQHEDVRQAQNVALFTRLEKECPPERRGTHFVVPGHGAELTQRRMRVSHARIQRHRGDLLGAGVPQERAPRAAAAR